MNCDVFAFGMDWICKNLFLWQTCLVYAIGIENYTFEAQTTHLRLHYTNYANDFVSAT